MDVGLLIADRVLPEFESIGGQYIDMFSRFLPDLKLSPYYVCDNEFPNRVDQHEAYICTGSKYSVYDDINWINNLRAFVKNIHDENIRFVGICFGHQMMAEATGGKVKKADSGWAIGVHELSMHSTETWTVPIADQLNVLMLCQDQVHHLPPNSRILASFPDCRVGMFMIGSNMLGIQGHPEFSKEYNEALFKSRIAAIGEEKVQKAQKIISKNLSNETIGAWVTSFVRLKK